MLRFNWLNSLRSLMHTTDGRRKPAGKRRRDRAVLQTVTGEVARATQQLETRALLAFNVTIDGSGNLVINDAAGTNDDLTIKSDTTANLFRISDTAQTFTTAISGATGSGTSSITVPFTAVTGANIQISGQNGDDSLTVDLSLGNFAKSVIFNAGLQTTRDMLTVTGGGTFTSVSHSFTNNTDGFINITGNSQIEYGSLDSTSILTDNLSATNRGFTGNASAKTITVTDATGANMSIDSNLAAAVTFANPLSTLTITAGTGTVNDTVTITSLDAAFTGSLTIDGGAGTDTVNLTPAISLGSLSIDNSETTNLNSGTVTTSGAQSYSGAVTLGAATTLNSNGGDSVFGGTPAGGSKNMTIASGTDAGTTTFTGAVSGIGDGTGAAITIDSTGLARFMSTVGGASGIVSSSSSGSTQFDGNVTLTNGTAASSFAGMTTLDGLTWSGYDGLTFTGAVTMSSGAVSLNSNGGNILLSSTLNGAQTVTLNAGSAGNITVSGTIGNVTPLAALNAGSTHGLHIGRGKAENAKHLRTRVLTSAENCQ